MAPLITIRIVFISLLLIAIYIGISIHTAIFAPLSVTGYLFSEAGAYEVFSPWLWYLLSILCVASFDMQWKTRIFAAIAAILLGLREMDFHKKIFETSFIKTRFYQSPDIALMDKILGFILLCFIISVFIYLAKTYITSLRNSHHKINLPNIYIIMTLLLAGLSKVLDRLTSQLDELFHIHLLHTTSVVITTVEESVEILLPILLMIAVLTYQKYKY